MLLLGAPAAAAPGARLVPALRMPLEEGGLANKPGLVPLVSGLAGPLKKPRESGGSRAAAGAAAAPAAEAEPPALLLEGWSSSAAAW